MFKWMLFKVSKKVKIYNLGNSSEKCVTKNFQKSPKQVTLLMSFISERTNEQLQQTEPSAINRLLLLPTFQEHNFCERVSSIRHLVESDASKDKK